MKRSSFLIGMLSVGWLSQASAKGLTVDDMLAMQRISEVAVSPDGKWVAYTLRTTDMAENQGRTDVWVMGRDGSAPRQLTATPEADTNPQWSSDSQTIFFLSGRGGASQVWKVPAAGGAATQVTTLPLEVNGFRVFPDNQRLLLAMDVWPRAGTIEQSAKLDAAKAASKENFMVYDQLLFRHWDQWEDGKFSHLFVWRPKGKGADVTDLTPGLQTDTPTHPFGGMDEAVLSPDGKWLAYVARVGGAKMAYTTNSDVFLVPTDPNPAALKKPINVTADNPAYDTRPLFSPDGKWLAVASMRRAGYEADKTRLRVIELARKKATWVTEQWDRSVGSYDWARDSKSVVCAADNLGQSSLFSIDIASGKVAMLVEKASNHEPQVLADGIIFQRDSLRQPTEIFAIKLDGNGLTQLSHVNDARVKAIAWGDAEQFTFAGAKGETVYAYAIKPPGLPKGEKAPVAMLIHGGPQGSFGDHFHYRWNPQAFAGHGYATLFIDFHGSTGYGQAFTDAINGDWGGAPYEDLMKGLDAAVAKFAWMDGTRVVAAGASYGGFMINWINGQTDRFRALVVHDGNLDERFAYYDTEELWFPEWEHGGVPYEKATGYAKHNPIDHVQKWKTPTLVVHGGRDYRVVDTQGMATFTALQRKGVPSRFLYFPGENHWVLRPLHSKRWHEEVLRWFDTYAKPAKAATRKA